ncbi:MAG: hypothetical protein AAGA45_04805, partial [Verrucomicrobiota bacterium]
MKRHLTLALALCTCTSLSAISTRTVEQHDFATFAAGEAENIAISNLGTLQMAPTLEEIATLDAPIIWDAVADA